MSNFLFDVTAETKETLAKLLDVVFDHNTPGNRMESYEIKTLVWSEYSGLPKELDGKKAMILRWAEKNETKNDGVVNLPFSFNASGATFFASEWLAVQDYGPQPDHDGSNRKGFRIYVGRYGRVLDDLYSICAVIPEWIEYGK